VVTVSTTKNPFTPRPDDEGKRERLASMKQRATGLLAISALVFGIASWLEARYPWLGYVRATAEASLVGGLADWFAVTALFRRPLGLPIPHTAIVATQKERIGRILGNFVQNHFLSRDVIAARLHAMHPSARIAGWVARPESGRLIARQVASAVAKGLEAVPADDMQALVYEAVAARVRATRVAPALGKTLSLIVAGNRHQELIDRAVQLAAKAVRDNRDLIRQQVRAELPWWVPSVIDERIYLKILGAIEGLLRDMGASPYHPVRAAFDRALFDFVDRLQHSPELIERAEALKGEWLDDPAIAELSQQLWETARSAILRYADGRGPDRPDGNPLERGISGFGAALLGNQALLDDLDARLIDLTVSIAEQNRQEVADLIAQTIASWDPEATVERIELAVGRDLQFVRMNGTLVGGLVGLIIYTIYRLWH
jgi:uncharacterized membrane-anchored protein YjiN (DUF445 family)